MFRAVAAFGDSSCSSQTLSIIFGSLRTKAFGHFDDGNGPFLVQALLW
jgi:hypothetical protein